MSSLLVVSRGFFRPGPSARARLNAILQSCASTLSTESDPVQFAVIDDPSRLKTLSPHAGDAVVLHLSRPARQAADETAAWVDSFLLEGGGVLAFGPALPWLFPDPNPGAPTGRKSRIVADGEVSRIFDDPESFTLTEPIVPSAHENSEDIHFRTDPQRLPAVWTRYRGRGHLCCIAFGRNAATFRTPETERVVRRAVSWVLNR